MRLAAVFCCVTVVVVAPPVLNSPASPRAGNAASACVASGERVIARSDKAVIMRRNGHEFACALDLGRRYRLAVKGPFAVGGYYVAYADGFCEESGCLEYVELMDLRRGWSGRKEVSIRLDPAKQCRATGSCTANLRKLVVNTRGAVAWATCPERQYHSGEDVVCSTRREPISVVRVDARGQRLLDNGSGIRGSSLRLSPSGTYVAWRSSSGRTRKARLIGAAPERKPGDPH